MEYLDSQRLLDPGQIDLVSAHRLADKALEAATRDIYTGGIDMVVVTKEGIIPCGKIIREEHTRAKRRSSNRIEKILNGLSNHLK